MITRRAAIVAAVALTLAAPAFAQSAYDLGPEQPGRPRTKPNPAAIAAISKDYQFVEPGVFTVATNAGTPPLATYATDSKTLVGADPDVAQLVADGLGLKLKLVPTPWADWPLGVISGKYDAAISNIGVTEQRKEKFDFSTYRLGLHGFFVKADSKVETIAEPKDAAGLRIVLGAGTNQERILLEWSRRNVAAGRQPIELITFDDEANRLLALSSGRADVIVQPHAQLLFIQQRDKNIKRVGVLSAGWPERSDVAVATRKGAGLAQAVTLALEGAYRDGSFDAVLKRWGVEEERLDKPETNPHGLPKY
ncbi:ABC transporter substrate-binding protein [Bosea sp. CS1GBMeth4]|uniref:ABC transporter substrate-binding protein n=1 Tax=Bosea sp. CS1GBMeth4 TaxID=1892849 RepID=UPI0016458369|nr:ABC transporter substrate-binding protein [Bosea sp. CS1GBMeth4]